MRENNQYELLLGRIKDLEKKVEHLRISRRVLMSLVTRQEQDKAVQILELLEENRRLRRTNNRFAQTLWLKNQQILELTISEKQGNS
ncbi:MAG: translation initiation factor 2 [Bacillota bacterium]